MTQRSAPDDPPATSADSPTPDGSATGSVTTDVRPRDPARALGDPFCNACGYALSGCTDSARCPECGRPLVEVLMRPELQFVGGRRRRTRARVLGMPAIDIAFGPSGNERVGRARGFIAVGDQARGVIAIGGRAHGVVAIGGIATGGVTFGGTSIGVVSLGGASMGGMALGGMAMGGLANGGMAIGGIAQGGAAIGYLVRGGAAAGARSFGGGGTGDIMNNPIFATAFGWFFGGGRGGPMVVLMPIILVMLLVATLSGLGLLRAWLAMNTEPGWDQT
ncbi:MAG: hypothetical protein AB8G96_10230 [Phycisphaerales bacterium]